MEIDVATLKALSADSRLKILKLLSGHRATGADISKRLGLSPSTVNEHLKKLESSGLITRIESGNKWIYYDVSEKGRALMHSNRSGSPPVQFVLVLSIGVLLFVGGALFAIAQRLQPSSTVTQPLAEAARAAVGEEAVIAGSVQALTTGQPSLLPVVTMLVGAVIIIVMLSSYYRNKKM